MTWRALAVGIVLVGVVTATGCSSSSGDPTASRPAATSTPASASQVPARNLKSQLLTVADLPVGWAIDNSADDSGGDSPPCLKNLKATLDTSDKTEANFIKGTDAPQFGQELGYYRTTAAATKTFKAGAAILNGCKNFSFSSDGHKYTGSIGGLSFPQLGQQSMAWQLAISTQGLTIGLDAVLVQRGSELALLKYADLGSPDVDEVVSLTRKAVAKLPRT